MFAVYATADKHTLNPVFTLLLLSFWFWKIQHLPNSLNAAYHSCYSPIHTACLLRSTIMAGGIHWKCNWKMLKVAHLIFCCRACIYSIDDAIRLINMTIETEMLTVVGWQYHCLRWNTESFQSLQPVEKLKPPLQTVPITLASDCGASLKLHGCINPLPSKPCHMLRSGLLSTPSQYGCLVRWAHTDIN